MKKVTSLSISQEQIDLIMKLMNPPEGEENCFDFVRNDDSGLDLYVETGGSGDLMD
ncbi:MAG: hypothetical protein QOK57_02650 [Nitrososphaeraceae archaeon]|nr:hypothetical protein [Nitrososphaeraceae archaeon]